MGVYSGAKSAAETRRRSNEAAKRGGGPAPSHSGESQAELLARIYADALAGPTLGADAVDIVRRLRDGGSY